MSENIELEDEQVSTLDRLLDLAEDATTPGSAVYLDEDSAEQVSDLRNTINQQVNN